MFRIAAITAVALAAACTPAPRFSEPLHPVARRNAGTPPAPPREQCIWASVGDRAINVCPPPRTQ